ncbi:MAG: hypothetical protein ACRD7E_20760 [Bryobacteraceae bacterium]
MVGPETEGPLLKAEEAPKEQPGAGEQHQRERNLGRSERATEAKRSSRSVDPRLPA